MKTFTMNAYDQMYAPLTPMFIAVYTHVYLSNSQSILEFNLLSGSLFYVCLFCFGWFCFGCFFVFLLWLVRLVLVGLVLVGFGWFVLVGLF